MRVLRSFLSIVAVSGCFALYGQTQGTPQAGETETAADQQAAQADSAASASMEMDQNAAVQVDTTGSEESDRASNTPAVGQRTTSQSGSPAVIAEDEGQGRDGTNNVQRAGINMAGSPVDNIKLDGSQAVDPNTEMRDRQDDSQEKQISAQSRSDGDATGVEGASSEIDENSRRENNAISDQNLSAKDKQVQSGEGKPDDRKDKKKARRKKSKS